jgi:hypothetical protein
MPAKSKILKNIQMVLLARDLAGGASTTVGAAGVAAGATVVPVTATNTFAAGDTVRIGAGENLELGVVDSVQAGVSITLEEPLVYPHVGGEAVVEQAAYDLGDVSDGGVTVTGSSQSTDVQVATRRLVFTTLNGYVDLTAEFALPGFTLDNFAVACGIPYDRIAGDGSTATPFSLATDGNDFGNEQNQSLIVIGVTQDGTPIRVELWGVDFDYTQFSAQLRRGQLATISVRAMAAAGGVASTNASAYVPNATHRASKGSVFDALEEVGFFADATVGPLATTIDTPVAAGQRVISLANVTNLVAGDWLRIGTGDTVEFHQVQAVDGAAKDVTLRTPLLRAQAVGVAAVRQQLVPIGGVSEDGVTLAVTGSVDPIRLATNRMSAGLRLGNAAVTLSFATTEYSLTNIARAFGIPASEIAGGRVPIGRKVGLARIDGAYVRGVLQNGTTAWINVWGCSQDVSNVAMVLNGQGAPPALPIALKPASGLHLLQVA